MREVFEYRGYEVSPNGGNYVARAIDGDDLSLVSTDVERITQAIDQMWDALDDGEAPGWLREPMIDLDDPSIAKHFSEKIISEKIIAPVQSPPLSHQRVGLLAISMLAIAVPLAIFMHWGLAETEPEIVFTLAVCAVAMIGTLPAVALSMASAVVYNYAIVPPVSTFTAPTREEVVYVLINLLASIAIPMILERVVEARRARVRTPNT